MKIFTIVVLAVLIIWLVASWIAIRSLEEPQYEKISSNKNYEIRLYKPYIIAIEIDDLKVDDVMSSNIASHLGKYGYSIIAKCKRTVFFCNV